MNRLERLRKKLDSNWVELQDELQIDITDKMVKIIENQLGLFNIYMREAERNNIEILDEAFTPRLKDMLQKKILEEENESEKFYQRTNSERHQ
tara:strand:- start:157 stop:435 length:279 start_codon:yes stop_codon:yes gene_type:complete